MKYFILSTALLLLAMQQPAAQCDVLTDLQVSSLAGEQLEANMECTDALGWTHYFHASENKILLSIKKNGQDLGTLATGLTVQAVTLAGYGNNGFNLSDADYIDNDVWIVANRYWQVTGAPAITAPVQVRFYFNDQDVEDLANSVDDFGFFVDEPEDLYMFTISGGSGLNPLATVTQPAGAVLTLFDMVPGPAPDWSSGMLNDFHFSEFDLTTLDNGGGIGFLIFQQDPPVSVSGKIERPDGSPVAGALVQAASASTDVTGPDGNYLCPTLIVGGNYEIVPSKNTNYLEFLSVADLVRMARHLLGTEPFGTSFEIIAADVDNDTQITFDDLDMLRKLLLGSITEFENSSWRFLPSWYEFPNPLEPFTPPFPETIGLNNLTDSLFNQNFTGVKIGDVAADETAAPPMLETKFSLPELSACNPGDTIEMALTVEQFLNIRGFQFTLEWDPATLKFLSVADFNLAGFGQPSVGSSSAADGNLSFAWFNPANLGSTVDDGEKLCKLRFEVTGGFGAATTLQFTGAVTDLLLLHQNLTQALPLFQNGSLAVENTSVLTATANIAHAGCNGEPIGSIDLSVGAGVPPLSFAWSNGAMTEDLGDLPGGVYRVTVSDASGNCPKMFAFNVAPTGPIDIQATVTGMSCPSTVDGAIQLEVGSGGEPYSFLWSNGKMTQNISGLFEGSYSVTVSDVAGCTNTASFAVENPNMIAPNVSITNASTGTTANGAVTINFITGGSAPFTFLWNTGAITQSVSGLLPGDYTVTITDAAGCQHVFGYLVNDLMTDTTEAGSRLGVSIFPNPAATGRLISLDLRSGTPALRTLRLLTPDGRVVFENEIATPAGSSLWQLSAPAVPGLYFLQMQTAGQQAAWAKLLVY